MKVSDLVSTGEFQLITEIDADPSIKGCYIGDLLSWVMAHLEESQSWVTIQSHVNVVAVAVLNEASCVILAEGSQLDEDAKAKAEEENLPVLSSRLSAYEIAVLINRMLMKND